MTQGVEHPTTVTRAREVTTQDSAVTIANPVQPIALNPLMSIDNWAPLALFIISVATIFAIFSKHISSKIREYKDSHQPVHDNIQKDFIDINQQVGNNRARLDTLEKSRMSDIERIVKLETNMLSIEKSQARIENTIDKIDKDQQHNFDMLAQSIREIRDVSRKP